MSELVKVLMERDELTLAEANDAVQEMVERMAEGEDPSEILYEEGLEPDYVFDLFDHANGIVI